jgi:hypothetical protein
MMMEIDVELTCESLGTSTERKTFNYEGRISELEGTRRLQHVFQSYTNRFAILLYCAF